MLAVPGKPLAVRRRGGSIHPILSALEHALSPKESVSTGKILQSAKKLQGKPTNQFLVQFGRKITLLFTITFLGKADSTTVESIKFEAPSVLNEDDCKAIRFACKLE